jgi:hypothetical protein
VALGRKIQLPEVKAGEFIREKKPANKWNNEQKSVRSWRGIRE